ncbi:MAG: peptidoglycan DD-metalloendopeptidase family protein [Bacteroidetes bacterium]|nr:peptidoglycan DD-metalloendopeptidase family protein [Bacteroidota bacterium]
MGTYPQTISSQTSARLDSLYSLQRKLDKEISLLTHARDSARSRKESSQAELRLINQQVGLREQLLAGLQGQMGELDNQIYATTAVIASLEQDIQLIKTQFGKLMVVTYKAFQKRNTSFYLMSSSSLSQGYHRMQYFQAIQRMQTSQMRLLKRTKAFLSQKYILLAQQKVDKEKVVMTEQMEQSKLVALKVEQKAVFDKLKQDEAKIARELQQSQNERAKLADEIKKELERIRKAKNDKIKTAKKEEIDVINKLNKDFASNKGKFPWPIPMPNASISRHFGRQTLPGSNTEIDVQGIDLTTVPAQNVRAIFGGLVESVMSIPGQGKMVIISHGTYYTVYANLSTINVKAQDKVLELGNIGAARTDPATGETKLYFQMNQDKISLDPELWLVKKG